MEAEFSIIKDLDHQNIAKVYEVNLNGILIKNNGDQIPVYYVVYEFLSLGEFPEQISIIGTFSEPIIRFFFRQLISALNYLHGKGYCHRDINLDNFLFDGKYNLKLINFVFGAPIKGRDGSGFLTTRIGKEGFMAPEIFKAEPYIGSKVDIFSSGIVLFMMGIGKLPFGKPDKHDHNYHQIETYNFDYFWSMHSNPQVSSEFKDLFQKMIAFNPNHRPSLEEIAAHPWMLGHTPTTEEIIEEFAHRKALLEASVGYYLNNVQGKEENLKVEEKKE